MLKEKNELEKNEEQITNTHGKKKRIITIITISILLLIVSVGTICVLKYQSENRYIPFEELDKEQIVLIQEIIALDEGEKWVYIRAVDAEGDAYLSTIPYDEWEGIEYFFNSITSEEIIVNRIYDNEIEHIYNYILQIDAEAEYERITMDYSLPIDSTGMSGFCYGVRYKVNGTVEYIMFWKKTGSGIEYRLDDSAAKEIYYSLGGFL